MSHRIPHLFRTVAQRLNVEQQDFILLESLGVTTFDEFYFRMPSESALENWIENTAFTFMGLYDHTGNPTSTLRNALIAVEEFKVSSQVAALRRLWHASKSTSPPVWHANLWT